MAPWRTMYRVGMGFPKPWISFALQPAHCKWSAAERKSRPVLLSWTAASKTPSCGVLSMTAKLLELEAVGGQRREIAVTKEEFLIGRGADCDLRLRVSAVSRHHCLRRVR